MTPERLSELKAMPASEYIHRMYAGLQEALREVERLKGELSAVREDAERYRAVRDIDQHSNEVFIVDHRIAEDGRLPRQEYLYGIKLDAAIDAARRA